VTSPSGAQIASTSNCRNEGQMPGQGKKVLTLCLYPANICLNHAAPLFLLTWTARLSCWNRKVVNYCLLLRGSLIALSFFFFFFLFSSITDGSQEVSHRSYGLRPQISMQFTIFKSIHRFSLKSVHKAQCIYRLDLLVRCNSECMWFPLKSLLLVWNAFGQNRLRSKMTTAKE